MINEQKSENKEKTKKRIIDYPTISINRALDYCKQIIDRDVSGIILRGTFEGLIKKHGGQLNYIIKSMKDYNLIERSGLSELKVTELGRDAAINRSKDTILNIFLSVSTNKSVYDRYGDIIPSKDVLINFINKNASPQQAKTMAGLYKEGLQYIQSLTITNIIQSRDTSKERTTTQVNKNINNEFFKIIFEVGAIRSLGDYWANARSKIEELRNLAKSNNLNSTSGVLTSILTISKDNDDLLENLGKLSEVVSESLKSDLNINEGISSK